MTTRKRRGGSVDVAAPQAQLDDERRLAAARAAVADYEADHGEITRDDMERANRDLQRRAIRIRI